MQHDHVLKKLNNDLLTPSPGSGGREGGVCRQNICYQVATFLILLYLICNMTMFKKKMNFNLLTPSPGSGDGVSKVCGQNILLACCYILDSF